MATNHIKQTEAEIRRDKEAKLMSGVDLFCSFYRANINRFAQDFLGVRLKWFQHVLMHAFDRFPNAIYLASRGQGKTWVSGVYIVCRCILYPGSKVAVVSKTRKQGSEVINKILSEIYPNSTNLQNEVSEIKTNQYDTYILFKNGSKIFLVSASDNARGSRSNILFVDEARFVDKKILDNVLKKFLTSPRHCGYLDTDKYRNYPLERNKQILVSSCGFEGEWLYNIANDYIDNMSADGNHFCCALGYQLAIKENLLTREFVEDEMLESSWDSIKHLVEMEALFFLQGESGLYNISDINKNRGLVYPWYPSTSNIKIQDKRIQIPAKKTGEKRILSADIALMSSVKGKNNDATSIHINSLSQTQSGRFVSNIVYSENNEGLTTQAQALNIRRLFQEFDCDKLVLDCRGLGLGVVDLLMADMDDPNTGELYGALSCYNNPEIEARCSVRGAPKVIYAVHATADFNSRCASLLREVFRQGQIKLLIPDFDMEDKLSALDGAGGKYSKLEAGDKANFHLPYLNTSLLVNELIGLEYTIVNNYIKIKEKSTARKDRAVSLMYNIYVSREIEREIRQKQANTQTTGLAQIFKFRAPKIQ